MPFPGDLKLPPGGWQPILFLFQNFCTFLGCVCVVTEREGPMTTCQPSPSFKVIQIGTRRYFLNLHSITIRIQRQSLRLSPYDDKVLSRLSFLRLFLYLSYDFLSQGGVCKFLRRRLPSPTQVDVPLGPWQSPVQN